MASDFALSRNTNGYPTLTIPERRPPSAKVRRNILANVLARGWGVVSVYFFVPIYLGFLGIEAYGLVGFYSTLLVVLMFADLGVTATLKREMARLSASDVLARSIGDVLRTYEIVYGAISIALSLLIVGFAPLIAVRWLRITQLNAGEVTTAIRLMGLALALELPAGLYAGGLMGLERQVLSNALQVGWGVLRAVGVTVVLWLVSRTIVAFFAWQLIANAVYFVAVRWFIWHEVSPFFKGARPQYRNSVIVETRKYAAGMAGMAIIFTLLTQVDKLAVSRMLSLEMLGYYTLAVALASVPAMFASPVSLAVFPRLTTLATRGDRAALEALYLRTCSLISMASIPAGITLALLARSFIFAWTGDDFIARQAGAVASLLLIGHFLQALLIVPYYIALAYGDVRINLINGVCSVMFVSPLLIFLIGRFGLIGAGIAWLTLNVLMLPIYMFFLHRRFALGSVRTWIYRFLLIPTLAAMPFALLGYFFAPETSSRVLIVFYIGLVWAASLTATILFTPHIRQLVGHQLKLTFSAP